MLNEQTFPEDPLEVDVPRNPACSARVRRHVESYFGDWMRGDSLDDLKLVATELVDNAYVHGRGEIRLRMELRSSIARVEVMDEGHGAAVKIRELGARGGGQGLRLVDHLSSAWGTFHGSTHVWAELPLTGAP